MPHAMARKPGVPRNKKGEKVNKTDFVLKYPGMAAKDIIAKAKTEGFALTDRYIYSIRSAARVRQDRKAAKAAAPVALGAAKGRPGGGKAQALAAPAASNAAEQALYAIAAQIGLGRAIVLLGQQQAIARAILGG